MQRKLKSVLHSSSKKHAQDSETDRHLDKTSSRSVHVDRRGASLDERRYQRPSDSPKDDPRRNGRSRPLSSIYDNHHASNASGLASQPVAIDYAQSHSLEPAIESIAQDYEAYLPALSPVDDSYDQQHMTLGGDRRLITGESEGQHEEDVANRNIDRYGNSLDVSKRKPLPATPVLNVADQGVPHKHSAGGGSSGSIVSSVPSRASAERSLLGGNMTSRSGLIDSTQPHTEVTAHERNQWKKSSLPNRAVCNESQLGWSNRRPRGSESDGEPWRSPPETLRARHMISSKHNGDLVESRKTGLDENDDIKKQIDQMLEGVVDLRDTVDTDQDVSFAPAVTHEVIKPHKHEIIQHKVFREIHNYEYFYYIQPVYDLEVLPPRHWIPNPNGKGLIEIDADELPSRTGYNRRWKIVREDVQLPSEMRPKWRTEPEVIEHPTTISDDGFERKETTVIYPPTLQDMTDYDGLVQPVHFDHKTGKRWLGEITTMHNLRLQMGQVADPADADSLTMNEVAEHLPQVPEVSQVPALSPTNQNFGRNAGGDVSSQSPIVKRKPINNGRTARMVG